MGATTPAPKSHRRTAPRRHAAVNAARRPPVAPAERVGVVHLTAEYWPFARTGGLGEAVSGLATTQAAAGHPTTVVMPLYQLVHETTPSLERTASALTVTLGGHTERAWLYRTPPGRDRKSTRLNSSHTVISYAVFCLKKKKQDTENKCGRRVSAEH